MKKLFLVAFAAIALSFVGCTTFKPVCATSNPLGSKVGTSTGVTILGLINIGEASIEKAARSSGITKISTVDQKITIIGGFYIGTTTIITGE